jgi:hypothetical protein
MKKLALSILTAIIICPSINSFAASARDTKVDDDYRSKPEAHLLARKKLKHRYHLQRLKHRYQSKLNYQRRLTNIKADLKMNTAKNRMINDLNNSISVDGSTYMEYGH